MTIKDLGDPRLEALPWTRAGSLTDEERGYDDFIAKYVDYYDNDPHRLALELYHPELLLVCFDGPERNGNRPETFVHGNGGDKGLAQVETTIKDSANTRRMRVDRVIPSGNIITIQAAVVDDAKPGWEVPFCSVQTFQDGKPISVHAYFQAASWPGFAVPE